MIFLVCIKQVPDVSGNVQTGRMVLNAYDASAVEAALVLSEGTDNEIHLILIGPESARETIRKALAMGASSATHLVTSTDAKLDSGAIAELLAAFSRSREYDVIACGKQSQDVDAGLTGGMLAEHLGIPYATNAVGLEIQNGSSGTNLIVTRQGDSGQEILELPVPCLVTCSNDMNNPRIPSLKGIMQAKKKEIEALPAEEGIRSNTLVLSLEDPASRAPARILEGELEEQVTELVRVLEEESGVL